MEAADFLGYDSLKKMARALIVDTMAESGGREHLSNYDLTAQERKAINDFLDWYYSEPEQTRNLVIFNDRNIQRVSTHVGADSERVKFSKNFEASPSPEGFFDVVRGKLEDFLVNPLGMAKEMGLGWLTLEQLAETVKSAAVSKYAGVMTQMQSFAKDRIAQAAKVDVQWAKLSDKVQARLSDVMRSATREGFDPATSAVPANKEQHRIKAAFSALPKEARDVYVQARDFYESGNEESRRILLDAANAAKRAGHNTAEVERMFAKVKGPYFPLMRVGGWYSVGMSKEVAALLDKQESGEITAQERDRLAELRKDPAHYVTRGHMSRLEAKRAVAALGDKYAIVRYNRSVEKASIDRSQLPDLAKVEAYIAADLPSDVRERVRDMMAQMYFDVLEERSDLKRRMKREGVHGEEENMRQVFAATALSSAHHLSRLKYANDLSAAMVQVSNEGRGGETQRMVENELKKRTKLAMQPDNNPFVDRILQTSYFAHLGVSPAFVLTNMTQVPIITLPWLGARHGFPTAGRAIAAATGDVIGLIRSTYTKGDWRSELNWSERFPPGSAEDKLLSTLLDRNLLDITMEHDLGAVAEMRNGKLDDVIKIVNLPVRVTELANRAVTGLAAYRLAMSKSGTTHDAAVEFAAKAISATQLNYSALNAPRHMQSVLGSKIIARLMFQFRKYQQGMVYLVAKNAFDALKGSTKGERDEARKTLYGLFATTGLTAGAIGLPFAGSLFWLASMLGGGGDDPFDAEVALRNWLADTFGKDIAAALAKGLPTLMGVDLSNRVGMGQIGSPLPFMRQGKTAHEQVGNALAAAAGAPVGMMTSVFDGIHEITTGNVAKGAEKIVPVKLAQNMIRTYRYDTEGMTNRRGEVILPDEKFSAWDLALRAAGFSPMKESEYYDANTAVMNRKTAASDARSELLRDYAQAKLAGEDTADVLEKIREFNARHREVGLRIDASSRLKAVQTRRKFASNRNEAGLVKDKSTRAFINTGRFAAP